MTQLTPLALEQAALLRRLAARDFDTKAALAADLGRDPSNLNKSLKALAAQGLVTAEDTLTPEGANAVRLIDRLDAAEDDRPASPAGFVQLVWMQIEPDPLNPRKHFDDESIEELADSIARDGLLENLVVRPGVIPPNDGSGRLIGPDGEGLPMHRLVAGERRHRAMKRLIERGDWGAAVPIMCKVLDIDDAAHRRIALVENLQRKDLRPIDEANALKELMAVTGAGTAEVAEQIGFTQRFVQQRLQLLELPAVKQVELQEGKITIEAARQFLANRPQEVELDADGWLLALEVYDAVKRSPVAGLQSWEPPATLVTAAAAEDERIGPNVLLGAVQQHRDKNGATGLRRVSVSSWHCEPQLQLHFGAEVTSREGRDLALARARADAGHQDLPRGQYVTPWLNGPFEPDPEIVAAAEQERSAQQERQRGWDEERTAREAEAKARRAATDAALGKARTLAAAPPAPASPPALAAALAELHPLPWKYIEEDGQVIDAQDQEVDFAGYDAPAIPILLMAAINHLAGHPAEIVQGNDESAADDDEDDVELTPALQALVGVPAEAS